MSEDSKTPKQPPSVGRVIHVVHSGMILAATVCMVHSDICVNAMVIDQQGNPFGKTSITYDEARTMHNTWSYPPFVPPAKKD